MQLNDQKTGSLGVNPAKLFTAQYLAQNKLQNKLIVSDTKYRTKYTN